MQYFQQLRLTYIEAHLVQYNKINRADLTETFNISSMQASKDLKYFQDQIQYDITRRCYVPKTKLNKSYEDSTNFLNHIYDIDELLIPL